LPALERPTEPSLQLRSACENQSERLGRVNALVELLPQRAFGFRGQIAFCRFLARQLGQDR
jgi:hypothetical protein